MFFPVSVTTPKMQRNERDDGRSMTASAASGGAPPSVPHRAPPALPPRSQRRRVEVRYQIAPHKFNCSFWLFFVKNVS